MININNLTKTYTTNTNKTIALDDIRFKVKEGDFLAITGKSGCGKSTLLNILGLIDKPTEGEYLFNSLNLDKLSEKQSSQFRKENIGFIFQDFNLLNELTVFENVALPLKYRKYTKIEIKQKVDAILNKFNIYHRKNHLISEISGGESQRTAIARSLVYSPKLILADEPTGNLDSENSKIIINLLKELNDEGHTIILVTHDMEIANNCKRQIILSDGKIIKGNWIANEKQ